MNENPPEPETGPEAKFRASLLLQWFVFPLLAVALCVGLYLSFRFLTADNKTSGDYLNDLGSGNPHRAWQAAFSLANEVNLDRLPENEKPAVGRRLLEMLDQSSPGAGQIRHYFILTLGRLRHADAVPKLLELARGPDTTEKIYALLALAEIKSPAALETAYQALQDEDPAVRKTAAHFFAIFVKAAPGEPPGLEKSSDITSHLRPLLRDSIPDVRWNTALALAEFRDTAAIPVLSEMLDREGVSAELKKSGGLDETNLEKIIKAALGAAAHLRDPGLEAKVRKLAESDRGAGIMAAAKQALERMGTN